MDQTEQRGVKARLSPTASLAPGSARVPNTVRSSAASSCQAASAARLAYPGRDQQPRGSWGCAQLLPPAQAPAAYPGSRPAILPAVPRAPEAESCRICCLKRFARPRCRLRLRWQRVSPAGNADAPGRGSGHGNAAGAALALGTLLLQDPPPARWHCWGPRGLRDSSERDLAVPQGITEGCPGRSGA